MGGGGRAAWCAAVLMTGPTAEPEPDRPSVRPRHEDRRASREGFFGRVHDVGRLRVRAPVTWVGMRMMTWAGAAHGWGAARLVARLVRVSMVAVGSAVACSLVEQTAIALTLKAVSPPFLEATLLVLGTMLLVVGGVLSLARRWDRVGRAGRVVQEGIVYAIWAVIEASRMTAPGPAVVLLVYLPLLVIGWRVPLLLTKRLGAESLIAPTAAIATAAVSAPAPGPFPPVTAASTVLALGAGCLAGTAKVVITAVPRRDLSERRTA